VALSEFERASYKLLGPSLSNTSVARKMRDDLRQAHMGLRVEAYLASIIVISAFVGAIAFILGVFAIFLLLPALGISLPVVAFLAVPLVAALAGGLTYVVLSSTPHS
jgi:hypothetical protein